MPGVPTMRGWVHASRAVDEPPTRHFLRRKSAFRRSIPAAANLNLSALDRGRRTCAKERPAEAGRCTTPAAPDYQQSARAAALAPVCVIVIVPQTSSA